MWTMLYCSIDSRNRFNQAAKQVAAFLGGIGCFVLPHIFQGFFQSLSDEFQVPNVDFNCWHGSLSLSNSLYGVERIVNHQMQEQQQCYAFLLQAYYNHIALQKT